ncbi:MULTISPECIES: beta-propeller fold lactonase family protein [unclassified Streptomyces]|uniref:beta-propeller fold lactonase family protein n=1 Tax=unclassified Streptomyces TaxID=2593676 RepID=UPI0036E77709
MLRHTLHRARAAATGLLATLALVPGGPLATSPAAAASPSATPPPHYLLVGGTGSADVGVLAVERDGTTSTVPGAPFATGIGSLSLAITPDARTVFVAQADGALTSYRIGPGGALTDGGRTLVGAPVLGLSITPDGARLFATLGGLRNEVRSFSIASSGQLTPTGRPGAHVAGLNVFALPAISPDGHYLFVAGYLTNTVTTFAIAPDATLTQVGEPIPTGDKPVMPTVTPDGRFLYISNEGGGSLSGYAIGPGGTLTPTPGGRYATGGTPHGTSITPDGHRLYVPESTGGNISGFQIGDDGALTRLPGSPFPGPGGGAMPGRVVLSPDTRRAFVIDALTPGVTSKVHSYVVGSDGSLTPSGLPTTDSGVVFSDGPSSEITPNQGPVAALRIAGAQGRTYTLSAQASTDSDGTIARYAWDFGDGETVTTTTPEVTHTYRDSSARTATVTITDDEDCSTRLIYTGQTVRCNGGPAARASLEVSG